MRIVFDVSPLSHTPLGIGNYIRGSLGGLVEAAGGKHEIVAFAPTSLRGPGRIRSALAGIDVELRLWPLPCVARGRGPSGAEPGVPRRSGCSAASTCSTSRTGCTHRRTQACARRRFTTSCLFTTRSGVRHERSRCTRGSSRTPPARCDLVFVNSAYTGRDVEETLAVPAERIRVAYPGVRDCFGPAGEAADLGAPYVLTVATLEPRKNLDALLQAHDLLGDELLLAVVGSEGWGEQPLLDRPRVRRLGFVSDEELARLYRGAAVAVYPSRFEGFGIPIVEAMASGCPVVSSSHPSLDEASGDAAVRADPEAPAAIAEAIEDALARREELGARGLEHAAAFTWRAAGETILRAYEEAVR